MYTGVYVRLCGELLWVGCRPKCECVCRRVLGTGPGQSECDAWFGETWGAGVTAGQHTLPPVPQSTPGTREPARQLCKFPHWARGGCRAAMLQPEWERTSEGQRAEAEHPPTPEVEGYSGPPSCSSFPPAPTSQGPQRRQEGREASLAVQELDTRVPSQALPSGPGCRG